MKYWAYGLKQAILEEKERSETKIDKKFLDPWISLQPGFLKKKLSKDILIIFNQDNFDFKENINFNNLEFPFWALLYPKRSYTPPGYPHLQLWFLGDYFVPSFSFLKKDQKDLFTRVLEILISGFGCFSSRTEKKDMKHVLAINGTPFSFIKNKQGRFVGGGQSVRTFHLHSLLLPNDLPRVEIEPKKAALVYPTSFSHKLFDLVFKQFGFENFEKTSRGISFEIKKDTEILVKTLDKLDKILLDLQLILIYSFYTDSKKYLEFLTEFILANKLDDINWEAKDLLLLGKERDLVEIKVLLERQLEKFAKKHNIKIIDTDIKELTQELVLNKDGDISSFIGKEKVVLRPGAGYGLMIEIKKQSFRVKLVPEDSLQLEGAMESNGYIFTEKIKLNKKPEWLNQMVDCLRPFLLFSN